MSAAAPVVLVSCNSDEYRGTQAHLVRSTYIHALTMHARCQTLLLPAVVEHFDPRSVLSRVDGLVLTGSNRHIDPVRYGAERNFHENELDTARDATTLTLLGVALEMDLPILAICRGFQELNVVQGGTLHQNVHDLPGKHDHFGGKDVPSVEKYHKRAHPVATQDGGLFASWGLPSEFPVNSIHSQGINRLGDGLVPEVVSDDGLIEAFSMPGKKFVVGVQWHPEGEIDVSESSVTLFRKFGESLVVKI